MCFCYNRLMYEIESTQGYVLSYYNQGESDRRYRIVTQDRGVIFVSAISVRKEASKLKHFLQKFNLVEIEIISSKSGYRITGGQLLQQISSNQLSFIGLSALDRVGELIGRLSQNQDADSDIFTIFGDLAHVLQDTGLSSAQIYIIEMWGTARVLNDFGYFDVTFCPDISPEIFTSAEFTHESMQSLMQKKSVLERYIKQSTLESML